MVTLANVRVWYGGGYADSPQFYYYPGVYPYRRWYPWRRHYPYPWRRPRRYISPAESYARGRATLMLAAAYSDKVEAEARISRAEAARHEQETQRQRAEDYHQLRRLHRETEEAQRRPPVGQADAARMAKAAGTARLRPEQLDPATGKVTWPPLLESEEFAASRADLERIFARRAAQGEITARQRAQVQQTAQAMLDRLREQVQDVPPMDYTTAKRFLQSLAYEVQ